MLNEKININQWYKVHEPEAIVKFIFCGDKMYRVLDFYDGRCWFAGSRAGAVKWIRDRRD